MTAYAHEARGALPPRQTEALAFINAEIAAGRGFPSCKAIAERMGWKHETSARDCLDRLVWRGKLKWKLDGRKRCGYEVAA